MEGVVLDKLRKFESRISVRHVNQILVRLPYGLLGAYKYRDFDRL